MNILVSTTTNWNPGDCWILYGVKNILKHIFPTQPNYIHYDRNPNNMVRWPEDQNMKYNLHGTFMNSPIDWDLIDLVVLAGSPEFLHHPLAPIYEGLVDHPEIPLWAIGVGYSEPKFVLPLTDAEVKVLSRQSTLIITRQEGLVNQLASILSPQIVYCQPCPALFCFEKFPEKTKDELNTDEAYINTDPNDVLKLIGEHRKIITNRLHGAIAGISSGATIELTNYSYRCQSAIELFNEVMESDPATITAFKVKTLNNYINIIKPYYDKSFTT